MESLSPKSVLATAIMIAAQKHCSQFDKGGMPYILHPLKVMHYLKTDDLELMAIAVLHDVVEDTPTTFKYLADMGISQRVLDGVRLLTKHPGETNEEYLDGIKTSKDAMLVKLADLRHNTDIRRLKGVTQKDAERLDKYVKMHHEITQFLKEMK
jgi:(p)ppGpp synthase/HD superfamily hydrolase